MQSSDGRVLLLGVREGDQRREGSTCACVGDGTRQVWRVLIGYLLFQRNCTRLPICLSICMHARESHLDCYNIPNDLSAEPLPHPVDFIVIVSPRSVIYPFPRIFPNELLKGPQFLIQATVVLTPYIGLSRDGLRHLASSWEWWEISRNQTAHRSVPRNWLEGAKRVYEHLQTNIFLSQKE